MATSRKTTATAKKTPPKTTDKAVKPDPILKSEGPLDRVVGLPKVEIKRFNLLIVGMSPLICHAWSQKARDEMLRKERKIAVASKAARDPEADFVASSYAMGEGKWGFPTMAIKKCLLASAHKDRGAPRTTVRGALWLNSNLVAVRPAFSAAICNMPLTRIYGGRNGRPEMREDMVRVGAGMKKTATFAYRSQFWPWAMIVSGRLNVSDCPIEWLMFLIQHGGMATGIGDWRNDKDGQFGLFRLAKPEEESSWRAYIGGRGKMPEAPEDFAENVEGEYLEAAE